MMSNNISDYKKIIFPGINIKDLKTVGSLLSPTHLVVTLSLISILAQISYSLKGLLNCKDIQKIPSVRMYSKVLSVGISAISFSALFSISKTLGPELEVLSLLNCKERLKFLLSLQKVVIEGKFLGRINSVSRIYNDPFELCSYRKALSLQCRSIFSSTPIFLPHSIVLGIPIAAINVNLVVDSCKLLWLFCGLTPEDFDFLLRKESLYCYNKLGLENIFSEPKDNYESCRILFYAEMREVLLFDNDLKFQDDLIVFRNMHNLTSLEKDFKFITRNLPTFSNNVSVSDCELDDNLIRVAVNQRNVYNSRLKNMF